MTHAKQLKIRCTDTTSDTGNGLVIRRSRVQASPPAPFFNVALPGALPGEPISPTYIYSWGPRLVVPGLPVLSRKGERCRVIARGRMNSACVEFEDGERAIVSRNALRRFPTPTEPPRPEVTR